MFVDEETPVEEKDSKQDKIEDLSALTPDPISAEKDESPAFEETSDPKVLAGKQESPVDEVGTAETKETPEEQQATPSEELASSSDKLKSEEEKPVAVETKTEENDAAGNLTRTESLENTLESETRSRSSSARSNSLRSVDEDTDTEIETNLQENLSKASSRSASPHEKDDFYDNEPVEEAAKKSTPVNELACSDLYQGEEKLMSPVTSTTAELKHETAAERPESAENENKVQTPESPEEVNKVLTPESPEKEYKIQSPESPKDENKFQTPESLEEENKVQTPEFSKDENKILTLESPEEDKKVQNPESPVEMSTSSTTLPVAEIPSEETEKVSAAVAEASSEASSPVKKEELILDLNEPNASAKSTYSSVENTPTMEKSLGEEKASSLEQNTPGSVAISPTKTKDEDLNEDLSTPVEEQKENLETPSDFGVQPTDAVEKPASLDAASKETTPSAEQTLESAATESVASPVQNSAVFSPNEVKLGSPTDENSNVSQTLQENQGLGEKQAEFKDENSNNLLEKPSSPVEQEQVLENLGSSQSYETSGPVTPQSDFKELDNNSVENVKVTKQEKNSEELITLSPVEHNNFKSEEVTKPIDETLESSVEAPLSPVEQSLSLESSEFPKNKELDSPAAQQSPEEVVTTSVETPKVTDQEADLKPSTPVEQATVLEEHKSFDGQQEAPDSLMAKPQSQEQEMDFEVVSHVRQGDAEKMTSPEICEKTEEQNEAPEPKLSTSSSKTFDENLSSPVKEDIVEAEENLVKPDVNTEPAAEEANKPAEAPNSQLMLENESPEKAFDSVSGTVSCQENDLVNVKLSPTEKQTPTNQEQCFELNKQPTPDLEEIMISNEAENAFGNESVTNQKTPETSAVNEMFEANNTEAEYSNSNIEKQC